MSERKRFYRGDLPHFLPNDRPYFLTFRLSGSEPKDDERLKLLLIQRKFREYDQELDTLKSSPHWLAEDRIANVVKEAIHYRDAKEYELHAFTIMSNHVHLVVTLNETKELFDILKEMKSYTAVQCNKLLGRQGEFWKHEGYDHVIRRGSFGNVIWYVLLNPVKAGLVKRWQDWPHTYLSPELKGFD